MYTNILSDFSRVIIKPVDKTYTVGPLNPIHRELVAQHGEDYDPSPYFELNEELLNFYSSLKGKYAIDLFTTDIIQNHPRIRPRLESVFSNIFSANELGLDKKKSTSYAFIADKLHVPPEHIIYIDDSVGNTVAAHAAGMKALRYTDNDKEIVEEVSALLSI